MFSYSTPKGKRTGFQCDIDTIRRYLCDIGNSWLLIAYRVYEMSVNEDFRSAGYKSIVEACEKELGFKKSTTYNFINVAKTYGKDKDGKISYHQLTTYGQYTYSQLVVMLSLGASQRAEVKPETPVSAIRMLKKSNEKDKPDVSRTSVRSSEPAEVFQTSGKISKPLERTETLETVSFIVPNNDNLQLEYSVDCDDVDVFVEFNDEFCQFVDTFTDDLCELYDTLRPIFTESDFDTFDPDDLEHRFSYIMHVYRSAQNAFKKQSELKNKSAV